MKYKKYLVICETQLTDGALLEMLKYFKVMLNNFGFFLRVRNCKILSSLFLHKSTNRNEASVGFFFLIFRTFMKKRFSLQRIVVILLL